MLGIHIVGIHLQVAQKLRICPLAGEILESLQDSCSLESGISGQRGGGDDVEEDGEGDNGCDRVVRVLNEEGDRLGSEVHYVVYLGMREEEELRRRSFYTLL